MRLADYTDYTLRVLMSCAADRDRLVTIAELAERLDLSKNHLMKIVNDLARQGLLETTRGRGGGLRLLKEPGEIRIGDVVRGAETDFRLVECFDGRVNNCAMSPTCRLKKVLDSALRAYFRELDGATLADITAGLADAEPAMAEPMPMMLPARSSPRTKGAAGRSPRERT